MKTVIKVLAVAAVLATSAAQAQYYPYNPYQRHSVPANNYARAYNQGTASAYWGMAQGGNQFMNGVAVGAQMAQQPIVVAPAPIYGGVPPGTPYGVPQQAYPYPYPVAPGYVPYIR